MSEWSSIKDVVQELTARDATIADLRAKLDVAREGLKHYTGYCDYPQMIMPASDRLDYGKIARDTLQAIGGEDG